MERRGIYSDVDRLSSFRQVLLGSVACKKHKGVVKVRTFVRLAVNLKRNIIVENLICTVSDGNAYIFCFWIFLLQVGCQ